VIVWRVATVVEVVRETHRAWAIVLEVPGWPSHVASQHVDLRLSAQYGYQTQRSYSIASAPEDERLALAVERIEDGEVSAYLTGELRVGDALDLRGPIGGPSVHLAHHPAGGPALRALSTRRARRDRTRPGTATAHLHLRPHQLRRPGGEPPRRTFTETPAIQRSYSMIALDA
jgi:FAD-dependent oxidoreductase family protein